MATDTITVGGYSITKLPDDGREKTERIPWASVRETFLWLAEKFAKVTPGPMVEIWFVPGWHKTKMEEYSEGWVEYKVEEYSFQCLPPQDTCLPTQDTSSIVTQEGAEIYEVSPFNYTGPIAPYMAERVILHAMPILKSEGTGWFLFAANRLHCDSDRTDNETEEEPELRWFNVKMIDGKVALFRCSSLLFFRAVKNYSPIFHELAALASGGLVGAEFSSGWGNWFSALYLINSVLPMEVGSLIIHDAALASEKLCRQIAASPKLWEQLATGYISPDISRNLGFLSVELPNRNIAGKDNSGNRESTDSQAPLLVERPVKIPIILNTWKDVDKYLADKIQWPNWNQEKRIAFLKCIIKNHAPHLLPQTQRKWPHILSLYIDELIPRLPDLIRQVAGRKSTRTQARKRPKKESGSATNI